MPRQVSDPRARPAAVSSWVHADFIRGLLPSKAQETGGEGALAKGRADYQSQEGEQSHPGLSSLPDVSSQGLSVQTGQKQKP